MTADMKDMVVILPGIMGSILQKDGKIIVSCELPLIMRNRNLDTQFYSIYLCQEENGTHE